MVPLALGKGLLNSDGDLGRHLRVGEYILNHGLLHRDIFSFTKLGQPFVGYEWLSEVGFAGVYRLGGLPAVSVACGLLVALTYAFLTRWLLARGIDPLLSYLTGILAAMLGSTHWLARPHLFTLLGTAILITLLERDERGARPWIFLPLFALWANLHGGFLFGLVVMGIYIAGDLAEAWASMDPSAWRLRARTDGAALGMGVVGSFLTPYGLELPRHVLGWFRMTFVMDNTMEYLSPDFHTLTGKFVLAVLLLVVTGLTLSPRRPTYPRLFLVLATIGFALISQRNVPLLGLTALPVLALHLDSAWRGLKDLGGIRGTFARESPGRRNGPWAVAVTVPLLLVTISPSPLARRGLVPGYFDPATFPVAATEKARAAGLTGRIYNDFTWGGYLLFAWPEQKVFIDGQTDFYGEELTRTHISIQGLYPGWRDQLKKWDISLVIMPTGSSLVHELARDPAWRVWHCDRTATVLRLEKAAAREPVDPDSAEAGLKTCASDS
jgi:hypothetical protein